MISTFIDKYARPVRSTPPASSSSNSSSGGSSSTPAGNTGVAAVQKAMQRGVLQKALQLAALLPQMPWADLRSAVMKNGPHVNPAAKQALDRLGLYMCTAPLLRVVCMLAMLGQLSEAQVQGVVSLIEGHPAGSSKTTFPLEEPPSLAEYREQHNITLADLSRAVLWDSRVVQLYAEHHIKPVAEHLVLAFGAQQLQMIATVIAELPRRTHSLVSITPEAEVMECLEGPQGDVYMGWVQACLLKVINEVLDAVGAESKWAGVEG
jgi:hypothetical protein